MRLPLDAGPGTSLPPHYLDLFRRSPTLDVELPDGTRAIAVTRHCDVRTVLSDNRFSRSAFGMHTLWNGPGSPSLALASSDPPVHTARRRAIHRWFTARRVEMMRRHVDHIADQLMDDVLSGGPPADIYTQFCHPLPNLVHMRLLGLDTADLAYLDRRVRVSWSCGHYPDDQVSKATFELNDYFEDRLARSRRGDTRDGLIDELARDDSTDKLTDAEIVTLTMGLFMSGAETSSNHLAMGLIEILQRPSLRDELRCDPGQIPSVVEELLRWVWFIGAAYRPHVALTQVRLQDRVISKGEVVVPISDVANRDPDVFPDSDEFRPYRSPNPHLGFGYGRHRCLGMALSRIELDVGLRVVLTRLPELSLVAGSELHWRAGMFTRGVWRLPVTWREGGR